MHRSILPGLLACSALASLSAWPASRPSTHASHAAYIGAAAARRAALRSVHGRALSARLESEEGRMQYAVMVRHGASTYEVMVDARTGRVASKEKVTAREEAREAAAEAHEARALRPTGRAHERHSSKAPASGAPAPR